MGGSSEQRCSSHDPIRHNCRHVAREEGRFQFGTNVHCLVRIERVHVALFLAGIARTFVAPNVGVPFLQIGQPIKSFEWAFFDNFNLDKDGHAPTVGEGIGVDVPGMVEWLLLELSPIVQDGLGHDGRRHDDPPGGHVVGFSRPVRHGSAALQKEGDVILEYVGGGPSYRVGGASKHSANE